MIVTVTLNAAMDRTLSVPNLQLGQRHRASLSFASAGGKGINVARALKRLGVPVVATGLTGGRNGTLRPATALILSGCSSAVCHTIGAPQSWPNRMAGPSPT